MTYLSTENSIINFNSIDNRMNVVGLPGFEPGSIEPKSTSLDQTSRQPRAVYSCREDNFARTIKTLAMSSLGLAVRAFMYGSLPVPIKKRRFYWTCFYPINIHRISTMQKVSSFRHSANKHKKWSLERALLPRPAAYEAAAPLGWAIEAYSAVIWDETVVFKH